MNRLCNPQYIHMLEKIALFYRFAFLFFRFGKEILRQQRYIRLYLMPILRPILDEKKEEFGEKEVKRMRYYASFVPAVSGAAYALLLNRQMTKNERIRMTLLSAASPLFDDYFDNAEMNLDDLYRLIQQPETFNPQNNWENALHSIICILKPQIPDFQNFMQVCMQVFDAQKAAKQQENGQLTYDEVKKLTFDKGGYSTLLFQTLMEMPPIEGQNQAIYHFGGLVQWVDDIFDLYEDTQAHIQTLASMETDFGKHTVAFTADLQALCHLFRNLPLPASQIQAFLDLQLFFFTRTYVCLHQFHQLQLSENQTFSPTKYERKALICDMEKRKNIVFWIQRFFYYRQLFTH